MKPFFQILFTSAAVLMSPQLSAQPSPPEQANVAEKERAAEEHLLALEQAHQKPLEGLVHEFEKNRFSVSYLTSTTAKERQALLANVREAAAQAGGAGLKPTPDGFALMLDGPKQFRIEIGVSDQSPFKISALSINELETSEPFQRSTLESQVDAIMTDGRSGLVYVALDGQPVLKKAYGMANIETRTPIRFDTIFGIGSRPIDFTIASIYLLEQQGKLSLEDRLDKYYPDAPPDRAGMTIKHMMTGQSGLPDFQANDSDWDADIAWIDRAEFERRTMAIPLLFDPGSKQAHSHWAFGVLAAIVERVSGESYSTFLRKNFFDPAGMTRTGDYGEHRNLKMSDFAEGRGKQVGIPNIPPNWGPTSWLVMGSGGMYSTLGDLQRFYKYVTTGGGLTGSHAKHFWQAQVHVDGSERGFELFSFSDENRSDEVYVFLNSGGGPDALRPFVRPMVKFIEEN